MAGQKNNRKQKDQAMAEYMKKKGIMRTTSQCPMCHHTIGLNTLPLHLGREVCRPRRPQYGRVKSQPQYKDAA